MSTAASPGTRTIVALILVVAVAEIAVAALVTHWILADDAYITLRYARNLAEHGELVYNRGEAVFGVPSPLWAFLTAGLFAVFDGAVEQAVVVFGIVAWSASAWIVARSTPPRLRLLVVAVFLLAPSFVDNRMLGMETPLFVLLLLGAGHAAQRRRPVAAATWTGLALVCRPEGLLFLAVLVAAVIGQRGLGPALRQLTRPAVLLLALAPGVAWTVWATATYGTPVPHSMFANSDWSAVRHASVATIDSTVATVPRLTFVPFLDHLPRSLATLVTGGLLAAIGWVVSRNVSRGTAYTRAALGFYVALVGYHLLGGDASAASWASLPPSVALLLAAIPAIPSWLGAPRAVGATALGLTLLSCLAVVQRAPLLASQHAAYDTCAREIDSLPEAHPAAEHPILVGEIGVLGFACDHPIVDLGARVSPDVLAWRSGGATFLGLVRGSRASFFVISEAALARNQVPTLGRVWGGEQELEWLHTSCHLVTHHAGKSVYHVHHVERVDEPRFPAAR